ncbi:MAG: S9 family peptidase [bacterium]|nr:S9 family peptidase [bacterium]
MRSIRIALLPALCAVLLSCAPTSGNHPPDVAPPVAKVDPFSLEQHGHERVDNYYWLKEREDPEVIDYLEQENEYTAALMQHTEDLQEALFEEIKGRIKQDDASVPYRFDDYFYYTRYEDGKEYPFYCRKRDSLEGEEEVMLDVNEMAEGHDYFSVGGRAISHDQQLLAYTEDTEGRRINTIRFKDLESGRTLTDAIPGVTRNIAWANDNKTLFYTKQDPQTLRWHRIYRHTLGTPASDDVLVFEETDDTFSSFVYRTKSKRYVMIGSSHTLSNEYRYLDADEPHGAFKVVEPREMGHEYGVDHYGDHFYIRTNHQAKNFRLMKAPVARTGKRHWKEVIAHRDDVLLENFEIFKEFLVVAERKAGLMQMRIKPWGAAAEHYIDFGEPAYWARIGTNYQFDTTTLRYVYSSMTTPRSEFDYGMRDKKKELLKQDEVLGGFDSADYVTERLHAKARDGVEVPISLMYRKDMRREGKNPLLLYGYGSYGASMDASFSSTRLSLVDRGFVYAIAHVRGGEELGRRWYEGGKLFHKKNTFTDFIDCAEYLVERKWADPERVFAQGGSAGGLLMGAVINMRPELFHGVVARVPFVDVITTMLDDSIPLTTSEYDEWGDPRKKAYYDYILSYSPYDNVEAKAYPNLLVTTGLHDSQVQYWEPAKWVAKLRASKTGDNRLLLKTNMEAGHGGASGRYKRYEQTAFYYAFLLDLAGLGS